MAEERRLTRGILRNSGFLFSPHYHRERLIIGQRRIITLHPSDHSANGAVCTIRVKTNFFCRKARRQDIRDSPVGPTLALKSPFSPRLHSLSGQAQAIEGAHPAACAIDPGQCAERSHPILPTLGRPTLVAKTFGRNDKNRLK